MAVSRVTQNPQANEQLLYFTSSSLTEDDGTLLIISDRTGHPNIFRRDLETGSELQLTYNKNGSLKSYVYFDGSPYRGFGKASVSLHSPSGFVYYIQGKEIRKISPNGKNTLLTKYPDNQMTAFTHVSHDGKYLCVPTTDERALECDKIENGMPGHNIDKRVREEKLNSYLRVYNTNTGEEVLREKVEQCWITHVQFSPIDNNKILYNHEWPTDCGIRRMWLFDGKNHLRLRPEGKGVSPLDWICHEMWERNGKGIIYHGRFHKGSSCIGRMNQDGSGRIEIELPEDYVRYGHFTVGDSDVLVSDGYYHEDGDSDVWGGDWISRLDVDWVAGQIKWTPLCRNSSSWNCQDAHPHPIIDHGMNYVYFTSDFDGKRAVYRVEI